MTTFGSVCSGIEAASVAWEPLGFRPAWFSEVDKAASALLATHWPEVENLGDMTKLAERIAAGEVEAPDVLVGGTPCQAFSIAGRRQGLSDARGQLTLSFMDIADAIDDRREADDDEPCVVVWENVPGVLSHEDNPFGCFLAGLAGDDEPLEPEPRPEAGKSSRHWSWRSANGVHVPKWAVSGLVLGPRRAVAWRVLDAQYFGLAQRRRRVFVVASAREGFDPGSLLLEFEGVRRDSPPSREAGEGVAGTLDARTEGGGFPGTDGACAGHDVPGERPGRSAGIEPIPLAEIGKGGTKIGDGPHGVGVGVEGDPMFTLQSGAIHGVAAFGGNNQAGPIDVATARSAHGGPHGVRHGRLDFETETFVVQSVALRGRDGGATAELGGEQAGTLRASGGGGDKPYVLAPCIAFSGKDYGADASREVSPTLRAMGHAGSHANAGGQVAIAFDTTQITHPANRSNPRPGDPCHPLAAQAHAPAIAYGISSDALDRSGEAATGSAAERSGLGITVEVSPVLKTRAQGVVHAFDARQQDVIQYGDMTGPLDTDGYTTGVCITGDITHTLKADGFDGSEDGSGRGQPLTVTQMAVRRLMPVECERLQGFPDGHTAVIGKNGKVQADGPRYKQIGNSMAVSCMAWIGRRLKAELAACAPSNDNEWRDLLLAVIGW